MSKRAIKLTINICGDFSVLGKISYYWNGQIPRGFETYQYQIIGKQSDIEEIKRQCDSLGLSNCKIEIN